MLDGLLLITLAICLVTDLKKRKIYNKVLLPALIIGLVLNFIDSGILGLIEAGKGFLIGLGFLIIPFIYGGIGAGDVKLLAVIGALKGPAFVFYTCLGMGLAGGLIAVVILIKQRKLLLTLKEVGRGFITAFITRFKVIDFNFKNENNMFPYGVAIAIGALSAFFVG